MVAIYGLTDPRDGIVRYVGITSRSVVDRVIEHIERSAYRPSHCASWIQGLLKLGLEPGWVVLEQCAKDQWPERECWWIAHFTNQGNRLTNMVEGGFGTLGQVHTPEAIAKIKAARALQVCSPETRIRLSVARTGRKHSASSIAKMRERKQSEEHVANRMASYLTNGAQVWATKKEKKSG